MENPFEPYECQFDNLGRRKLIAATLRDLRTLNHYSQKELAAILGIPQQTYNGYEKERSDVPIELLVRLSFLYDTSLDVLTQRNYFIKNSTEVEDYLKEQSRLLDEAYQKLLAEGASKEDAEKLMAPLRQMLNTTKALVNQPEIKKQIDSITQDETNK